MVEIAFYTLTILAVLMVLALLKHHPNSKRIFQNYLLTIFIWTTYLLIISNSGLLNNFGLPPRLPLFVVIPAVLIILVLANRDGLQTVIRKTPIYLPIFLQSFRILVELLIYAVFLEGIFPQRATFEGLNFDIFVGVSSIFIGFATLKGVMGLKGIMIWNIVSLCILLLTVYSFISTYYFTDFALTGEGRKLIEFPYLLLPSYLLPIAVFLHVFSIKQILFRFKN